MYSLGTGSFLQPIFRALLCAKPCAIYADRQFSKQETHVLKKFHSSWEDGRQTGQAVLGRRT